MMNAIIWDTNRHLGVVAVGLNHQRTQTKQIANPIPQATVNCFLFIIFY